MRFALLIAALALTGCSTPCPDTSAVARTRNFVCADGSGLVVTFNPAPAFAHIVQEGFAPIDLPTDITGSGYRYAEGGAELRGRPGAGAHWTRPGAEVTLCREAR